VAAEIAFISATGSVRRPRGLCQDHRMCAEHSKKRIENFMPCMARTGSWSFKDGLCSFVVVGCFGDTPVSRVVWCHHIRGLAARGQLIEFDLPQCYSTS